jgi:hypothetical protein
VVNEPGYEQSVPAAALPQAGGDRADYRDVERDEPVGGEPGLVTASTIGAAAGLVSPDVAVAGAGLTPVIEEFSAGSTEG